MPVLHQGLAGNHGYPLDRRLNRVPGKYDDDHDDESARMINFGRQKMGRTGWNKYENYGDPGGGGGGGCGVGGGFGKGIEFRADNKGEESGTASPPLWKTSPSSSPPPPTDTTPLQSHPFNHHHYRLLSPDSRTQLILKGRQELMDMVKQMPETSYELSLKDLVELPKVGVERKTGFAEEREFSNGGMTQAENRRRKRSDKGKMGRSGSGSLNRNNNNNGPFLLKMFFPISLGWKQKGSTNGTCAKVSPRPLVEGEKGEKDWWKKRFSVAGESGSSGRSGSSGGSSSGGSSGSRNRNRSRNMGAFLPACWPFIWTKKSSARDQKESIF